MTDYTQLATTLGGLAGAGTAIYFGQPELIPLATGAGAALGGAIASSSNKKKKKHQKKKSN